MLFAGKGLIAVAAPYVFGLAVLVFTVAKGVALIRERSHTEASRFLSENEMINLFRLTYSSLYPTFHDGYERSATRNDPQRIAKSYERLFDEVSR